jgi:glycogen operon protein
MDRRRPTASINFVTCHDGFTLTDLVSYDEKRNESNGESNCDGENNNRSWNCGVEGPTSDEAINALRARQRRNLLATLLLSQGVPMLLGGDEIGRTQRGNNNAYCHDNEVSWVDWEHGNCDLFAFVQQLIVLRREHRVFRSRHFNTEEIGWYRNDGERMGADDWNTPWAKGIAMFLNGSSADDPDDDFYIAFNADYEPLTFTIPRELGRLWRILVDTAGASASPTPSPRGITFDVEAHSLVVACHRSTLLRVRPKQD